MAILMYLVIDFFWKSGGRTAVKAMESPAAKTLLSIIEASIKAVGGRPIIALFTHLIARILDITNRNSIIKFANRLPQMKRHLFYHNLSALAIGPSPEFWVGPLSIHFQDPKTTQRMFRVFLKLSVSSKDIVLQSGGQEVMLRETFQDLPRGGGQNNVPQQEERQEQAHINNNNEDDHRSLELSSSSDNSLDDSNASRLAGEHFAHNGVE